MRSITQKLAAAFLALATLCGAGLSYAADPTEQEMRDEYARWVISLGSYQYRTRHILVPSREEAAAALAEINGGATFASVATRVSRDPGSASKGGDLGWVRRGDLVPEFTVAFRNTETGLYPEPVRTPYGWHVIHVEEVRPVQVPRFEEVRGRLEAGMKKARAAGVAAAPGVPPQPLPNWTPAQWNDVFAAAEHSAGGTSYVYREYSFSELEPAQRASDFGPTRETAPQRASNLIDVEPHLRFALARLYRPDDRSAPIAHTLPDGRQRWTVLQLVSRGVAAPLQLTPRFRSDAAVWVAKGRLPGPDQLTGPQAMARSAYFHAVTAQQIAGVPATLSADLEYGNLGTPLLGAMIRKDMEAAKALVQRGADVNRCGIWACPIAYAARMDDAAESLAWVDWLLSNGARADAVDPRGPDIFSTALGGASFRGHLQVAQRLVEAGASVNGVAGGPNTPIEGAASQANKPMVEWLVSRGASVLPLPDRGLHGFGPATLYNAARESKDAAFIQWAEQTMLRAAAQNPRYGFTVQFEQDGKRMSADPGGNLRLKPAPFKMVFRFPEGADGVQLGASFQAAWLEEFRKTDLRNAMFRPFASGAQADATKPNSQDLFTMQACPATVKAEDSCEGTHMFLNLDPADREDFHERRTAGGKSYVREVRTLFDTSGSPGVSAEAAPLEKFAGQTLYLVAGVPLALGGPTGFRFVKAQTLRIQFGR